jgi:EAL domain-containing protein (putative c-di-GMP-specific phosphodiesterase class I)
MKKSIRLFLLAPFVALLTVAACYAGFKAFERSIIEDNEALVHSVAQSILPALLADDAQEVDRVLKRLASNPGIQTAELVSSAGVPLASYVRDAEALDPSQTQFALASAEESLGNHGLHVMAPLTFDTQILANLHIAVNLWPAYLRLIQWMGAFLILLSALYVVVKRAHLKIHYEKIFNNADSDADGSFNIDHALDDALVESDISIEYQPINRMSDNGMFGAEVVVCWKHPSGQTLHISPADFIALAEKSGLFLPFGNWVLETACKQFAVWQRLHGPLILSINIAPSQLQDIDFLEKVIDVSASSQYPHQLIEFEINEADLLRLPTALADVQSFVQQGMSLTLDGFGMSSRSAEFMESLPLNKIKFAGQLIKNVADDADMLSHVEMLANRALAHGVQIMADGLHDQAQTKVMQKLGCVFGQGPFMGHALSVKQFEALLVQQMHHSFGRLHGSKLGLSSPALQ